MILWNTGIHSIITVLIHTCNSGHIWPPSPFWARRGCRWLLRHRVDPWVRSRFFHFLVGCVCAFSALTLLVGWQEGHPVCKKTEWWGAGMVICLKRGADLHMFQPLPLPLTVSCFSKIQIGFAFLVPAHLGSPGKGPINVCVLVGCVGSTIAKVLRKIWKDYVNAFKARLDKISLDLVARKCANIYIFIKK